MTRPVVKNLPTLSSLSPSLPKGNSFPLLHDGQIYKLRACLGPLLKIFVPQDLGANRPEAFGLRYSLPNLKFRYSSWRRRMAFIVLVGILSWLTVILMRPRAEGKKGWTWILSWTKNMISSQDWNNCNLLPLNKIDPICGLFTFSALHCCPQEADETPHDTPQSSGMPQKQRFHDISIILSVVKN